MISCIQLAARSYPSYILSARIYEAWAMADLQMFYDGNNDNDNRNQCKREPYCYLTPSDAHSLTVQGLRLHHDV